MRVTLRLTDPNGVEIDSWVITCDQQYATEVHAKVDEINTQLHVLVEDAMKGKAYYDEEE